MANEPCPRCASALMRTAHFCPQCGYQLRGRAEAQARRATLAILLLFGGILAVLLSQAFLDLAPVESAGAYLARQISLTLAFLACGLLALPLLGGGAWSESLAGPAAPSELALGLGVGLLGWIASSLYVLLLLQLLEPHAAVEAPSFEPKLAAVLFTSVVLPALSEEWTDRGVLWVALRRVVGPGATIFCSALAFAFMHGLNGAGLFEVPHRFLLGLALGWLRQRSGSLWPCIVAHALHNGLAVLV